MQGSTTKYALRISNFLGENKPWGDPILEGQYISGLRPPKGYKAHQGLCWKNDDHPSQLFNSIDEAEIFWNNNRKWFLEVEIVEIQIKTIRSI